MSKELPGPLDYTTPLFVQHEFLKDGHGKHTVNATGTFVKFGGRHYVVTCGHVVLAADPSKGSVLSVVVGRAIYKLAHSSKDGPVPTTKIPEADFNGKTADVAISPIDHAWSRIVTIKAKNAIDLDDWTEPKWSVITTARACGWLNNYKETTSETLATQGVEVVAELASSISSSSSEFTMYGTCTHGAEIVLSGISGGVIVASQSDVEVPFGLVFEGFPGEGQSGECSTDDTFLKPGDIMVRGHVLTPDIFENWLSRL